MNSDSANDSARDSEYQAQLAVAIEAVKAAQKVIQHYFDSGFSVETKSDSSPVTIADINAEKAIRQVLLEAFPEYGFYGEETGSERRDSRYLWLVDPIDGTKSYVRRSPYFSTQIGLMFDGELVAGVSNAPLYGDPKVGEMASAIKNGGGQIRGESLATSRVTEMSKAYLSSGNIAALASDPKRWSAFGTLVGQVARVRGYGDFCHYHQLASGQADLVVESNVNILDIAALTVIVREAGGVMTDLEGQAITLETTGILAAATAELHDQALSILQAR